MSMNYAEIDAVLAELPLAGSFLQNIRQSDYSHILLDMYCKDGPYYLLISLKPNALRFHRTETRFRALAQPPRFVKYLRAHLKGGKILNARQIGSERIIDLEIGRAGEIFHLYIRLWGGSANLIVTDQGGVILDAFSRRPSRKEIPGEVFSPQDFIRDGKRDAEVRAWSGAESFNGFLDGFYGSQEEDEELLQLRDKVRKHLQDSEGRIKSRIRKLRKQEAEYGRSEDLRKWGDLIISGMHNINKGDDFFLADDYESPGKTVRISLDPKLSPYDNAQKYFKQSRKAKTGLSLLQEELSQKERQLAQLAEDLVRIENCSEPEEMQGFLPVQTKAERKGEDIPGLSFQSGGYQILVGRTAKENDALLRRHVRGNDLWLHTRDYPGGYVFIRSERGKSVPLDVLLDAGNLAVHYSKAKKNGGADLFYTQVKYLRRAKGASLGTVLPTQEKNLYVKIEDERLKRLLG